MAESTSKWLSEAWSKLQERFSAAGSTSALPIKPKLKQLNEMVYEVYCPTPEQKPELEIVLFHGLQVGSSKDAYFTTWMSHDNSQMWPQTWLVDAFPKARILAVAYDAAAKRTNEAGLLDMFCTGENLLSMLTSDFVHVGKDRCPIVLVGHCLGGLLLKELCLHASATLIEKKPEIPGMQRVRNFFHNLRAMFFYGTPHNGSLLDDKQYDSLDGPLMKDIEILNTHSARRNSRFHRLKAHYEWSTYGVGETRDTFVNSLGRYIRLVPEASSRADMDEYYSVDGNHYEICTPEGKHSAPFTLLRDFLHQIHQDGLLRLGAAPLTGIEYYVERFGRATDVQSMLEQPNGQTVFITGLPGIGKTALAKQVFQDISYNFELACFVDLDSIGAQWDDREQVLKKIEVELKRQDQGWNYEYWSVPLYLRGRKVLIIVDNVQSKCQLDALDREMWLAGSSSRLVVTTADSLLGSRSNTFEVEYLHEWESQDLFLHYAFEGRPVPEHLEHSIGEVIEKCGDFPLCLKILGRYLSKGDLHKQNIWEDLIVRLKNGEEVASGHDYRFWGRLRPCYDALAESEQEMFLDVATLFCDWPLNIVEYIWSGCRHSASMGWTNLMDGFLVKVNAGGRIWMHELLRNLGRSIACPQSSRVNEWRRVFGESYVRKFMEHCQEFADTLSLELQVMKNERLILTNTPFLQYDKLQYLILEGVEMTQETVNLPSSLVFLRWKGGLFETCPVDFNLVQNLVVLELKDCKVMQFFPPNVVTLKKLKWLELEGCQSLKELPSGICEFCELEYLGLSMTGLTKLPKSFGKLKNLRDFRANQAQLKQVPKSIGRLSTLQTLNISNTAVRVLPESIGELGMLRELLIQNTAVKVLPESIGGLKSLTKLDASNTRLRSLPDNIGQLGKLELLHIRNTAVKVLPESIGGLKSLTRLDASNTRLSSLPDNIGQLERLGGIWINNTVVEVLPESICGLRSLGYLFATNTRLSSLPDRIGQLERLWVLAVNDTCLTCLPQSIGDLDDLQLLNLSSTPLETLPDSLCRLRNLQKLFLRDTQISALPDAFGELQNLRELDLRGSRMRSLPKASKLGFEGCEVKLTFSAIVNNDRHLSSGAVPTILGSVEDVPCSVDVCYRIYDESNDVENGLVPEEGQTLAMHFAFPAYKLSHWGNIHEMKVTGGSCDQSLLPALFYALQQLPSLTNLELIAFEKVETFPSELGTLRRLRGLEIRSCRKLRELPESLGLLETRHLILTDLPRLCRLPESLVNLRLLKILDCGSLQSMPRSWGHRSSLERDQPMSRDDRCSTSDACPTLVHAFNVSFLVTNSWSVLRCLIECCHPGRCQLITFVLKCGAMQKVMEAVVERTGRDLGVATKVFRELCLKIYAGDDGEHEVFNHSTSWPRFYNIVVGCSGRDPFNSICKACLGEHKENHLGVRVCETDLEEDDDEDTEEESLEEDDDDEDTEEESVEDEAEEAMEDIEESAYEEDKEIDQHEEEI